jgi:MerR family transcriptional regulator, light-induced transcriptional regulator
MPHPTETHRIGAVSRLSGVPVPTLRIWEARYGTFAPLKSAGHHRLYSDDDVLRATLLKRLTEQGHAISRIAHLDADALNQLLLQHHTATWQTSQQNMAKKTLSAAVVGLPLAGRMGAKPFSLGLLHNALRITDIFETIDEALNAALTQVPDLLLVRIHSLHVPAQAVIQTLLSTHRISQTIVLYNFGQTPVIAAMRRAGILVRREPISDTELAELIRSVMLIDPHHALGDTIPSAMIPARKYSDSTLARIAALNPKLLCECPRHMADILVLLGSFEQYSQECLNQSAAEAHLHAYLSATAGSARALFEHALEMLAEHEGLTLT